MQTWVAVFIIIAAVAIIFQTVLLVAFYLLIKQTSVTLTKLASDIESKLTPVLSRVDQLMEESHKQMTDIINDTADIVRTVKNTGRRFDRVLEEAADRLRLQIIQADKLLTGAMEAVEEAGTQLRNSVIEPVRTASALVKGVRAGVEFFRGRRHMPNRAREAQDEELFI